MSAFVPATKDEAKAAATASAFTDEDGRTTVHSILLSGNLMLGADWDLADLIAEIDTSLELMWFDDPMGHHLAMKSARGLFYKFEVARPTSTKDGS